MTTLSLATETWTPSSLAWRCVAGPLHPSTLTLLVARHPTECGRLLGRSLPGTARRIVFRSVVHLRTTLISVGNEPLVIEHADELLTSRDGAMHAMRQRLWLDRRPGPVLFVVHDDLLAGGHDFDLVLRLRVTRDHATLACEKNRFGATGASLRWPRSES